MGRHWGYLLHGHLCFRREAHVSRRRRVAPLSAHGSDAPRLPDGQFVNVISVSPLLQMQNVSLS